MVNYPRIGAGETTWSTIDTLPSKVVQKLYFIEIILKENNNFFSGSYGNLITNGRFTKPKANIHVFATIATSMS